MKGGSLVCCMLPLILIQPIGKLISLVKHFFSLKKKIYIPPHKPFAPSTGRGGMVQNAMMSRRALIDSSSFVRSAGGLEASLFAAINDLILKYEGGITKCSSSCFRSWIGNSMRLRIT